MTPADAPMSPPGPLHIASAPAGLDARQLPAWEAARGLPAGTPRLVMGQADPAEPLLWMVTRQARGWIRTGLDRPALEAAVAQLPASYAAFAARGFVEADSLMLALGRSAGQLPRLSWGDAIEPPVRLPRPIETRHRLDLYAIVDNAQRLEAVLGAGIRTVQVRIKPPARRDTTWDTDLRAQLTRSLALAREAGAELFINDHAEVAITLGARGLHLGQEDLLALGAAGRADLAHRISGGLALGISSHSVWELCRARSLPARYIACGPVWATVTKEMPWIPQGLDNLGWWQRQAGAPVVAIGGILTPGQVQAVAATGVDGVCLVRGLGEDPSRTVPDFKAALDRGRAIGAAPPPAAWDEALHPSLPGQVQ